MSYEQISDALFDAVNGRMMDREMADSILDAISELKRLRVENAALSGAAELMIDEADELRAELAAARPLIEAAMGATFKRAPGIWEENLRRAALSYRKEKGEKK